jgi:hypothetical protein
MATDNVGNGFAVDVPNGDLGQGFDCDPTCSCPADPLWVFRGGAIILQRSTPPASTLAFDQNGPSLISANDFHFGFRAGFEVGAIRRLSDCWDIDMRYLQIDSLNASVGPVDTESSAVFFQQRIATYVDSVPPHQIRADYGSVLRSAEINARRQTRDWLTFLVGFRYLNLLESLSVDQSTFVTHGVDTRNDLYGGQVGVETSLACRGRLRLDGWAKAGLYGNDSQSRYDLRFQDGQEVIINQSAGRSQLAFVGDVSLTASYSLTEHTSLRAGYQLLWVDGVALASDQFGLTLPLIENAIAIDSTSGVFFHGATLGVEVSW